MKNVKAGGINVLGVICWYGAWLAAAHPVGAQLSGDLWNVFDESFTPPGTAWVERDQQPGRILALGEQADGRVLVGGVFDQFGVSRPGLVRLELDGRVDASFAPELSSDAGVVTVRSIVVRDGGRILIAGNFTRVNGVERPGLARLEPAGGLDRSFDPGAGPGLTVGGLGVPAVRWMLPGPGSSLYVGGWFDRFNGHPRPGVARLLSDGTVDPAFVPALEPGAGYNVAALTPDGGVLLGGGPNLEAGYELVKLGSDGSRAPGFKPEVGIAGSLGAGPAVRALAVDNDGKIYVGGDFSAVGGVERHRLARLLPDGTLDSAFDPAELPDNGQGGGAVT